MRAVILTVLLALAGMTTVCIGADPERPKFDNLPADAEVHVVAVSEAHAAGISRKEITDVQGLVKALRAKDGPGAHIRKLLSKDADELLTDAVEMGRFGKDANPVIGKARVAQRLSNILEGAIQERVFYDKDAFAKVELTKGLKEFVALGDKRTVFQTERMNRELLSLVFADFLAETPVDYHTVHVAVQPGKPVVLVTSASTQTRWVVKVEKGATVAGVIQFGNTAQELVGTDAPVIYRAGILPNGKKGPVQGFNAYKQDDKEPSYKRIKGEVKEYTGKDFTSFQGQYQSGKEPFVVKPGAK